MAMVAHVLHTPIGELWEMDLEELSAWADEAVKLQRRLYDFRRR